MYQTTKNDHDRRSFSVFSVCANFFSGDFFNCLMSIILTASVADSLEVSFKSGEMRYIDFVANPSTGNTRPLVGKTEA